MNIIDIKKAIGQGKVKITDHADEEAENDFLTFDEIYHSVYIDGEIIKEYSEDKPYPSCLILGNTFRGEPIHSVWAYNKESEWAVLITVYRPNSEKWKEDWKERK
jgi:hypothetical protein